MLGSWSCLWIFCCILNIQSYLWIWEILQEHPTKPPFCLEFSSWLTAKKSTILKLVVYLWCREGNHLAESFCGHRLFPVSSRGDFQKHFRVGIYGFILCPILCDPMYCSPPGSLPMEFSRQENCSEQPFPSPGYLPNPGIKPGSHALQADSLPYEPPQEPQ